MNLYLKPINYNLLMKKKHISLYDGSESIVQSGCSTEDERVACMLDVKLKSERT